jgi:hypothetical protein
MADEFIGVEIAVIVVTASILFAGLLIGLGRAFSYKRIENFGVEELVQSVVNAAIIGAFAGIIELINAVSSNVVSETCGAGDAIAQLICTIKNAELSLFSMFGELSQLSQTLGYYQSLSLDFTSYSIQPFANLSGLSDILLSQLLSLEVLLVLLNLNLEILTFIAQNALLLLFPVGLVLRTFFATRKLGGFLISLSLGLYILYPSFILVFPDPSEDLDAAALDMASINNNSIYASAPVLDLNDNYAIAGKLDLMSGKCFRPPFSESETCGNLTSEYGITGNKTVDFSGDLTVISQMNAQAISKVTLYSVFAPLFSLLITIVFVKEVGMLLGSEIGIASIASL